MKKIQQKMALIFNFILLSTVYLVGVGITSITARIFGKNFLLDKNKRKSNFSTFKQTNNLERMF